MLRVERLLADIPPAPDTPFADWVTVHAALLSEKLKLTPVRSGYLHWVNVPPPVMVHCPDTSRAGPASAGVSVLSTSQPKVAKIHTMSQSDILLKTRLKK